jgi:hypothetical protein
MLLDDVKELPVSKWGILLNPRIADRMKAMSRQARCYVFDRDASLKLGQFIRSCPDVLAEQLEFAIEPYPVTYIEVEIDAVIDGTGRAGSQAGPKSDWKVGFLSAAGVTNTLVCNREIVGTLGGAYGFARMDAVPPRTTSDEDIIEKTAAQLLGGTYNDLNDKQRREFTNRYCVMYFGAREMENLAAKEIMEGHMGECRTYAAALLLLHQKKGIALTEKPAYRTMYRGKSRPFMSHNVVTITLDGPVEIRKAMSSGSGETRRAHEVPAHYAHRYGTRNCEHVWVKRETEEHHWDCSKCGRFRYLRRDHVRGDASKGFVKKSYNVTMRDR